MRVRPVWIVLAALLLPVLVAIGWRTLPREQGSGACNAVSHITPDEADAVVFSTALRKQIIDNLGGPFELRVTDDQLTSYVALNTRGRQLADPQIHFLSNIVCLSGHVVGLGWVRPRFRIQAHPDVADGDLQFEIQHLTVNGRVMPRWLRNLAQRVVNETIHDASLPVRVTALQVRAGELVVTGTRLSAPR